MANRLNAPNQFETLSPPWILSQLDTNFTQNQAAWNDSSLGFVNGIPIDTGSANVYTVALPFGTPSAYQDGMTVPFIPNNTNTGASTMTVSPLGAVSILNPAGIALSGGEIIKNATQLLVYKSAAPVGFRIVGPCPLSIELTGQSGNWTVNCAGYTSIYLVGGWTSGANLVVTLNNVGYGVPIFLWMSNSIAGTQHWSLTITDPAGTALTTINAVAAGAVNGSNNFSILTGSGFLSIQNGSALTLKGSIVSPLSAWFSV